MTHISEYMIGNRYNSGAIRHSDHILRRSMSKYRIDIDHSLK